MSCVLSYNFFNKLLASTLFPLVLAAIILGLGKLTSLLRRDPADQRAAWIYAYSWFLLLTYVVFTGASTTVLRFFNCVEYVSRDATGSRETLRVLQADHSISCDSPSYGAWKGYAVIMVFIYPIGIPLLYLCELLYHRKAINPEVDERRHHRADAYDRGAAPQTPDQRAYFRFRARESKSMRDLRHQAFQDVELSKEEIQQRKIEARSGDESIAHLEFLFAEYEPRCYLFIIFECVRRLMLTGLLIFIYAGSLTQIIVGQFIAVISMRILSMANPYIEDIDDSLANMGQLQIVLVFIASLVLFAKDMPEQEGAPGNIFKGPLFAFVMVLIGTMTLLMTFYMLVAEYCGIESPKDAQEAASSVASSLRRFSRGRNLFSDTKVPQATDDADAAPEEIVVTPHGHDAGSDQY